MKKALLLGLGGLIVVAFIGSLSSMDHIAATSAQRMAQLEPEKPGCDAKKAEEIVEALINKEHVFRHIKTTSKIPKVTVDSRWYTLDFEIKKSFNNAVACYLTNGNTSDIPLVAYLDPRTEKKVAESGPYGFSMK